VGVLVFAGVAWFFVTLSVESSLVPITDVIFEHRMYLPMVGAAVAVSAGLLWALDRWFAAVPAGKGVALLLLLTAGPLTGATIARNRIWRDDVSLWTDVVEKSPGKARAHYNLGVALLEAGRLGDAEARLQAALRIEPSYAAAMGTLGRIHEARGRPAEAYQAFVEALRLDPRQILIRNDLGLLLQKVGRLDEAERELREAVRRDPSLSVVRNSLAGVLAARGELGAAEREYREAGRLAPDSPAAQLNLGQLLRSTGRHEEALRAFDLALAADPRLAAAWDGIGGVRMGQGRPAEAVQAFERSLALAPGPLTRVNLGLALQAAGRPEAALSAFRSFLEAPADASPELVAVVRRRVTALGGEGR
jgi:tetratricopeptide (TPR) repeat protein